MIDKPTIDDADENWLTALRLKGLRQRGWTGTFAEWQCAWSRLRNDPLDVGQTSPTDADVVAAKKRG